MSNADDNRTTELRATERLRALLDERGVEYDIADGWWTSWDTAGASDVGAVVYCEDLGSGLEIRWHTITPEQAIAATLGRPKAKSHPYGYERDTGAYDCTRCECGCINDISAAYCNDCGGKIEIDESAEKEYYDGYSKHAVFAKKHDDGSLEFGGKRYVAATLGSEREKTLEKLVQNLYADYYSEWPDRAEEAYAERMKELGIKVIDE